ncbi:MAG: TRAP transporter TatT component family protein [Deltaproteobacteria bacterium]|nr:TRAP transporter TatT component family protein [Deltaproteobacteria bacterium]
MNALRSILRRYRFLARSFVIPVVFLLVSGSGCGAVRRAEVRGMAELFTKPPGSDVFLQDDDPELIREALPFALKTFEVLLASDPENRDLCQVTAEAFVTYAHAFVFDEAERMEALDFKRAQVLQKRAEKLYLRGRDYAFQGLSLDHPNFEKRLRNDPENALKSLSQRDVPLVYWAAAGWAGAISSDRGNMSLVAELPVAVAMMRRCLELDEDFGDGMIHEFFITYEGSRSEAMGGSAQRAREHFVRAVNLTGEQKAWPYVALASSVAVRKQDYKMFNNLLEKALAVDPDAVPKWRLSNILAQEKAKWLLDHGADLFIDYSEDKS